MATETKSKQLYRADLETGITRVSVSGYKSIVSEQSIEISPLTILAGANSSGKSSIMQPLLLLKQTLEATYDPGALLLNGPNVRLTSLDQLFSRVGAEGRSETFSVGIGTGYGTSLRVVFRRQPGKKLDIDEMLITIGDATTRLRPIMSHDQILSLVPASLQALGSSIAERGNRRLNWRVVRNRCFLELTLMDEKGNRVIGSGDSPPPEVESSILELVHLPGLRGNPERTYPVTAVGSAFPGTFEKYVASVITQWQAQKDSGRLARLGDDLQMLGLTWKVTAVPVDDTQVELQVGRLPRAARGGARDLVSMADVGFGVSQTLPVLVAVHAAQPGQLLYLEQPEIHLHPRAQFAMAQVLADAASRGVRVVAETHSSLLLLGIQALVAEGRLSPGLVKLHWFKRDHKTGATQVTSAELDESGAFGDWPEDFAEVHLNAEKRYLDAAEAHPSWS